MIITSRLREEHRERLQQVTEVIGEKKEQKRLQREEKGKEKLKTGQKKHYT